MKNTWTEIDLGTLRENIERVSGAARSEIVFVVKSNAYGHGMIPIAQCAAQCGVKWFAVSGMDEALELREALPDVHVVVLGVIEPDSVPAAIDMGITPIVVSGKHASALAAAARQHGGALSCHAKIDSGMGRLGFLHGDAPDELERVAGEGLDISGICMHFASAAGTPDNFAEEQWSRFSNVVAACEERGIKPGFRHASNSAAFARHPEWDLDGARTGILLYGYGSESDGKRARTDPLLQWKTRIVQVKEVPADFRVGYYSTYVTASATRIATIAVGYADGVSRLMSNKGSVLVGGRRVPVVGSVTMNLSTVDLGPGSDAGEGDEVVLVGRQDGESIWADEVARWCRTIPYEVLTSIRTTDRRYL